MRRHPGLHQGVGLNETGYLSGFSGRKNPLMIAFSRTFESRRRIGCKKRNWSFSV